MKAREAVRELSKIAETQRGLVTTRQAARSGVPRLTLARLEDDGAIERLTHGVYRVGGAPHAEHESLRAYWLALDPERTVAERIADKSRMIAVSHRSAADVHGIGDLYADEHQYTATYRKQSAREGVRVSQRAIDASDVQVADGMLVTTPERTIADLARTEPDESHVADALGDAIIARSTSRKKLVREVSGRALADREQKVDRMLAYKGLDTAGLAGRLAISSIAAPALEHITRNIAAGALTQFSEILGHTTGNKPWWSSDAMLARDLAPPSWISANVGAAGFLKAWEESGASKAISASVAQIGAASIADLFSGADWETLRDVDAAASVVGDASDDE